LKIEATYWKFKKFEPRRYEEVSPISTDVKYVEILVKSPVTLPPVEISLEKTQVVKGEELRTIIKIHK